MPNLKVDFYSLMKKKQLWMRVKAEKPNTVDSPKTSPKPAMQKNAKYAS